MKVNKRLLYETAYLKCLQKCKSADCIDKCLKKSQKKKTNTRKKKKRSKKKSFKKKISSIV